MNSAIIIDHFDSFTANICRYVRVTGSFADIVSYENIPDEINHSHIILSPGPMSPEHYNETLEVIERYAHHKKILGICLGHQMIAYYYGHTVKHANCVTHGQSQTILHSKETIFLDIPSPLNVGCYNSLAIKDKPDSVLQVLARNDSGDIMSVKHNKLPIFGVQFHPESVLTEFGQQLIKNFMEI